MPRLKLDETAPPSYEGPAATAMDRGGGATATETTTTSMAADGTQTGTTTTTILNPDGSKTTEKVTDGK